MSATDLVHLACVLCKFKHAALELAQFTEAAKDHSNDDGISRHRLASFDAYYLTYSHQFPIPVQLKHTFKGINCITIYTLSR